MIIFPTDKFVQKVLPYDLAWMLPQLIILATDKFVPKVILAWMLPHLTIVPTDTFVPKVILELMLPHLTIVPTDTFDDDSYSECEDKSAMFINNSCGFISDDDNQLG